MFADDLLKAAEGLSGANQGMKVKQLKLMTRGMTSGGAEAILKGSIPTNSVDKLKLKNAYNAANGNILRLVFCDAG